MIQKVEIVHTKPAYNILECDGENLQARIAASMSREPALMDLFKNGGDFHAKNAYATMAKYTFFTPYLVSYSDGTSEEIMEWESFDLERGKHIQVKDLQEGDLVHDKKVVKVEKGQSRKIDETEYAKNAKKGRLKDIRTTAKFCFGKGTEILTSDGWKSIETLVDCSIKDLGVLFQGNLKVMGEDGQLKEIFGTMYHSRSPMISFELEDGSIIKLTCDHELEVIRNGKRVNVRADEVLETDELIEYGLKEYGVKI